jgi:hypothetical protein
MRELILKQLKEIFDDGGLTTAGGEDDITDFAAEVETLNDEELLELYEWTVGFQG